MAIKVTKQSLNPYELLKQRYASNPIVTKYGDDWNTFAASQRLPQYLTVLDEYGKKGKKLSDLQSTYKSDFLTSDERLLALANDVMGDAVTKVTKKREVPDMAHSDEQGTYQRTDPATGKPLYRTEEYETTDYDYTKNLLLDIANERENKYLTAEAFNAKSTSEKFKNFVNSTTTAAVGGFVHGVASFAGDIQNLFTGIYDGFKAAAGTDIYTDKDKVFMDAFRARMATPLGYVTDIDSGFADLLMDPETGEYISNAARYIYSGFDSLGRMAPGLLLSATGVGIFGAGSKLASMTSQASHFMFYTSMAAGNMSELFQNPNLASRPTAELILNASLRAAVESAIETGLDKALGSTMVDSMMYGYNKIAIPKGAGSVYARLAKDALQEGTEEVLQDWSNYLINQAFGLMDENYKYLSEWNLQTMTDAFMMGAVMSLAGSGFRIMTTKRFDTGIAKTNKQGDIKYDKKGEIKTKKLGKFASYKYYYNIETLSQDLSQVIYDKSLTVQERTRLMGGVYTTLKTITDVFGSLGEERYNRAAQLLNAISENAVATTKFDYTSDEVLNEDYKRVVADLGEFKDFILQKANSKLSAKEIDKINKAKTYSEVLRTVKNIFGINLRADIANWLGFKSELDLEDFTRGKMLPADEFLLKTEKSSEFEASYAANQVIKQINNLKVDFKVEGNPTFKKQLKESKITKIKDIFTKKSAEQQLKELVQKPVAQRTAEDTSTIAEIKAISDILNNGNFRQVVTAEDGVNIAQDENSKTLVAPSNIIKNCSTNEIFRNIAEQNLVETIIATPQLKGVLSQILDIYKEFKSDNTVTIDQALRDLYFDSTFINMLLDKSGIDKIVTLLSKTDTITKSISIKNTQDAIYKNTFKVVNDNIAKSLLVYYLRSGDVGYRTLSIFTSQQKSYIADYRAQLEWLQKAQSKTFVPTAIDLDIFEDTLNLYAKSITTDMRQSLITKFSKGGIYSAEAVSELNKISGYKMRVANEYDNIHYADIRTDAGKTFNAFMSKMGLTEIAAVSIMPHNVDIRETINDDFEGDPIAYYRSQFEEFTADKYTFDYDLSKAVPNRFTVRPLTEQVYDAVVISKEMSTKKGDKTEDLSQGTKSYDVVNEQSFEGLGKIGETILEKVKLADNIPDAVKASLTINDIVQDISLLNENTLTKIRNEYGEVSADTVEMYLGKILKDSNYYLVKTEDGKVVLSKILYAEELLTKNFFDNIDSLKKGERRLIHEFVNNDFIKYGIKDVVVEGEHFGSNEGGYFDPNTNTLYVNLDDTASLKLGTFTHEFTHAVQYHNNLTFGYDPREIIDKWTTANKNKLVSELKKYVPSVFSEAYKRRVGARNNIEAAAWFVYTNVAGEAEARGYALNGPEHFLPIIATSNGDIIMPWGTMYIDPTHITPIKSALAKKVSKETSTEKKLTAEEFGQAINQKAGKTKRVKSEGRSFTYKEEASHSNMKYLWEAAHREGKPYVLTDTRIKDLIVATTNNEKYLDPEFMRKVRNGEMRTVSDLLKYVISYDTITPEINNTIKLINKYWFKNDYVTSARVLDQLATEGVKRLYATRSAIRALLLSKPEVAEAFGLSDALITSMDVKTLFKNINELLKQPNFKRRYEEIYDGFDKIGGKNLDVDYKLLRISILNNFVGNIESGAAIASWARSLAINQKLRDSSISLDSESESKDSGTRSLSETIADVNAQIDYELGQSWFNDIADTSRAERENLVFENKLNEYIAKLQSSSEDVLLKDMKLIQRTLSHDTDDEGNWISPLRQDIANMTDDELDVAYLAYKYTSGTDFAELREQIANQLKDAKGGVVERPRYKVAQSVKYLAEKIRKLLTPDELKAFTDEYPELVYSENGKYILPREDIGDNKTRPIDIVKVLQLEETFKELAAKAYAIKVARERFLTAEDALAKTKATVKELKSKLKAEREATKSTGSKVVYVNTKGDTNISIVSTRAIPDKFDKLLNTNFEKTLSKTKVKYLTAEGEMHTRKSLATFVSENAETLATMTVDEARDIVNFIQNSSPVINAVDADSLSTYRAISMYTLAYIYTNSKGKYAIFQLTPEELVTIEGIVSSSASAAGTELAISKQVLENFNPAKYIVKSLAASMRINFSESTLNELAELTSKISIKDTEGMDINESQEVTLANIAELNKLFNKMYNEGVAQYKGTNKYSVFDQLWKFQRMAMLSSPGTWLRNWTSNQMLKVANKASAVIGDATFSILNRLENRFSKTKVESKPVRNLTDAQKSLVHFAEDTVGYKTDFVTEEKLVENYDSAITKLDKKIELQEKYKVSVIAKYKELYDANLLQKLNDAKVAITLDHEYRLANLEYKQNVADKVSVRRTMYGQYQIKGTAISNDVAVFVKNYILDSGFYDMLGESINKYTAGEFLESRQSASKNLANMIIASVQSEIFNDETFKVPDWWKKVSKKGAAATGLNMWNRLVYKAISDDPWVRKAFASYLGKILTEDDVNLNHGISNEVQAHIIDAYKMAAWDYMHKSNFFSAMEKALRTHMSEGGFFIYKQIAPFAVSAWNWFKEGLNYTPLGLGKAIIEYVKLENKVAKMNADAAEGMGPTGRWAAYIVKRNIGKGTIGTIGFIIGALLAGFGVAGIDEQDKKIKLRVGDVYIDISNLFGTQGILLGMVFANFFADDGIVAKSKAADKNGFGVFLDCAGAFFDQLFIDSTFSDLYNIFEYTNSFSDVLVNMTDNTLSSFIPNFLKVINNATYNHKVKYSKGFLGMLERKVVQTVPGIAYAYPKQYDVYTGKLKYQYGSGWWGIFQKAANSALPIKVYPYSVSDIEKEAILSGVNKGQLTGNYSNIKSFTPAQTSKLNEYYGELNSTDLAELKANRKKYKVKDEKTGKYVELTYSKMTAKQKNNVISRIMEDNAEIAKIYVYTSSGGKYYAETETIFQTLRSLRIKNVFRATGNKKGFN